MAPAWRGEHSKYCHDAQSEMWSLAQSGPVNSQSWGHSQCQEEDHKMFRADRCRGQEFINSDISAEEVKGEKHTPEDERRWATPYQKRTRTNQPSAQFLGTEISPRMEAEKGERIVKWLFPFKRLKYISWIAWNHTHLEWESTLNWLEYVIYHLESSGWLRDQIWAVKQQFFHYTLESNGRL